MGRISKHESSITQNYFSVSLTHCVWSASDQRRNPVGNGLPSSSILRIQSVHGLARDFALLIPLTVCPHSRLNVYVLMCITSLIVKHSITRVKKFVKRHFTK